jgi:DNA-binding Xre family transcriptional regulator
MLWIDYCYQSGMIPLVMVRLKVRELAEAKGILRPMDLARASGLSFSVVHKLWSGNQTRIDLATIDALCIALKVKPGQLIEFTEAADQAIAEPAVNQSDMPRAWRPLLKEINKKTNLNISQLTLVSFLADQTEGIPQYVVKLLRAGQEGRLDEYLLQNPVERYLKKNKAAH